MIDELPAPATNGHREVRRHSGLAHALGAFIAVTACVLISSMSVAAESKSWSSRFCEPGKGRGQFNEPEAREATRSRPNDTIAWCRLGYALSEDHRFPEAEDAYRRAITLDPHHLPSLYNLAEIFRSPDFHAKEAEELYRRLLQLSLTDHDKAEVLMRFAELLMGQGRHSEAEALYHQSARLEPNIREPWIELARLLRVERRWKDAEQAYRKALAIDPDFRRIWDELGKILDEQGRSVDAKAAYTQAQHLEEQQRPIDIWYTEALKLAKQGRWIDAERWYSGAVRSTPRSYNDVDKILVVASWYGLSHALMKQNRSAEATEAYRQAERTLSAQSPHPFNAHDWYQHLTEQGRSVEAEQVLRQIVTTKPDAPDKQSKFELAQAWFYLGHLLEDKRDAHQEAEQAYRKAIQMQPDNWVSWTTLGDLLRRQKRWQEAADAYRTVLTRRPNDTLVWSNLAGLYANRGLWTDAEQVYREAIRLNPKDEFLPKYLTEMQETRATENKREELEKGVEELDALAEQHRWADMERLARGLLQRHPGERVLYFKLSKALARLDRADEARQAYEPVRQWCPDGVVSEIANSGGRGVTCTRYGPAVASGMPPSQHQETLVQRSPLETIDHLYPRCRGLQFTQTLLGTPPYATEKRELADDLSLSVSNEELVSVTLPLAVQTALTNVAHQRGIQMTIPLALPLVRWYQRHYKPDRPTNVAPLCYIVSLIRDGNLPLLQQMIDQFTAETKFGLPTAPTSNADASQNAATIEKRGAL